MAQAIEYCPERVEVTKSIEQLNREVTQLSARIRERNNERVQLIYMFILFLFPFVNVNMMYVFLHWLVTNLSCLYFKGSELI